MALKLKRKRSSREKGIILPPRSIWEVTGIPEPHCSDEVEPFLEMIRGCHFLSRLLNVHFAQVNLTVPQFGILVILYHHPGGITQDEVRRRLVVSRPNVKDLVDRLVKIGWVKSHLHPRDNRRRLLELTPTGKTIFQKAFKLHHPFVAGLFDHFTRAERITLARLLRKLRGRLENEAR